MLDFSHHVDLFVCSDIKHISDLAGRRMTALVESLANFHVEAVLNLDMYVCICIPFHEDFAG